VLRIPAGRSIAGDRGTSISPAGPVASLSWSGRLQSSHTALTFPGRCWHRPDPCAQVPEVGTWGAAESLLYKVRTYVETQSLPDRLNREKQLRLEEALHIATEVTGALAHAHSGDVAHRDTKPENILLPSGNAVVGDFGSPVGTSIRRRSSSSAAGDGAFWVRSPTRLHRSTAYACRRRRISSSRRSMGSRWIFGGRCIVCGIDRTWRPKTLFKR